MGDVTPQSATVDGASPAERRLRNWVRDRVLSGDIIVEQNIHVIDICNWVLQSHPLKVTATGGRQGRPADDGDCYGNYNAVFHYPNNVKVTFSSTQFAKGWWDVSERFFGTKGTSISPYTGPLGIWGDEPWQAPLVQAPGQQAMFSVTGNFTSNLQSADPSSTLRIMLDGAQTVTTPRAPNKGSMPGYAKLSDQEIADLTTYIRNAWGNAAPGVAAADVAKARKAK